MRTSAAASPKARFSSSSLPLPTYEWASGRARCCTTSSIVCTPAVRASSRSSASSSASRPGGSTATASPRSGSAPGAGSGCRGVTGGLCVRRGPAKDSGAFSIRLSASVPPVRVSPVLATQTTYPFVRIEQAKRERAARGVEIFDFGQGDPREPTDPLIRQALVDALADTRGYPKAEGLPELRVAIAGWLARRFGVSVDPDTEVVPTLGSKEAIFSFAQVVVDP